MKKKTNLFYGVRYKPNHSNPSRSVAQIEFDKQPLPHVWERLISWGFKPDKQFKTFAAQFRELWEQKPVVWHTFIRSYGYRIATGLGDAEEVVPYIPASDSGMLLDTVIPNSMADDAHMAIRKVEKKMGGDIAEYVREKLHFATKEELIECLGAEQVDAVGLAIYNIEVKKRAIIVGDQTGIGKGRIAAGLTRYAHFNKRLPIFITEQNNLFTDFYRDMADLKMKHLRPFIVNAKERKSSIYETLIEKDKEGILFEKEILLYAPPEASEQQAIIKSCRLPQNYDLVMATYSQFRSKTFSDKMRFLTEVSNGAILIMDESHNASGGESNTGIFFRSILDKVQGAMFLSATFAKRPENMATYARKTCLSETKMHDDELAFSMKRGGVAMQEIVSAQLVGEGEMIRRQRSTEGIEVKYLVLEADARKHIALADEATEIIRDIINFQNVHVRPFVDELESIMIDGGEIEVTKGTKNGGVDNPPFVSRVFNIINQLLLCIKADSIADDAIAQLKAGRKPIIALANTMEAALEELPGNVEIPVTFSYVLKRGLHSVMKVTITDMKGQKRQEIIPIEEMPFEARQEYDRILSVCDDMSTGINVSPIDWITKRIMDAGYSCVEVTGRDKGVLFTSPTTGKVVPRNQIVKKMTKPQAFYGFNNNKIDCLIINQSGSTGASAHAVITKMIPLHEVKQRVLIGAQFQADVNTEVQIRGRINRTGQVLLPVYRYQSTAIPAEMRLQMMMQKKLKSLDANTKSSQKASTTTATDDRVVDFLNKYGDELAEEYLTENPDIDELMGEPLKNHSGDEGSKIGKVTGRVAILPVEMQTKFYETLSQRYIDKVELLKNKDEYDLEVETVKLDAVKLEESKAVVGAGGKTVFGSDAMLCVYEVDNLRKPMDKKYIEKSIADNLDGEEPLAYTKNIIEQMRKFYENRVNHDIEKLNERFDEAIAAIKEEKKYLKLKDSEEKKEYIKTRTDEINQTRETAIENATLRAQNIVSSNRSKMQLFYPGRGIYMQGYNPGETLHGLFLGFAINMNETNPFAPSAIRLKFAVCDVRSLLTLSLSGDQLAEVNKIIGTSYNMSEESQKYALENWDTLIKEFSNPRIKAKIVTGNVLLGMKEFKGRLIKFTLRNGGYEVGIVLPVGDVSGGTVKVPIKKAAKYIKSLRREGVVVITGEITLKRIWNGYLLILPKGGKTRHIFNHPELCKLMRGNNGFNERSGLMKGEFDESVVDDVIQLLGDEFSMAIEMPRSMYDAVFGEDTPVVDDALDPDTIHARKKLESDRTTYEKRMREQKAKAEQRKQKPSHNADADTMAITLAMQVKMKMVKAKFRLMKNKMK